MSHKVTIPVMRYVGGEDYEVLDHYVKDTDATPQQLRAVLRQLVDGDNFIHTPAAYARWYGLTTKRALRHYKEAERNVLRMQRRLWLLLKRKGG